ncbi:MAG: heme-binding domain-containing protein [Gemmatimonadota bacterium]|nr:MAG: heme-binding domain-containing protein [Gemmatimonadota bacterium]
MSKRVWVPVVGAFGVLVLIQLWPVERANPPVTAEIAAPPEVMEVLRVACYDCHSNETRWPWYGYVAPVSWLVAHDVNEAREELNFSEWGLLSAEDAAELREEVWEEVEEGEMPLRKYVWLHPEARLSREQRQVLQMWSGAGEQEEH